MFRSTPFNKEEVYFLTRSYSSYKSFFVKILNEIYFGKVLSREARKVLVYETSKIQIQNLTISALKMLRDQCKTSRDIDNSIIHTESSHSPIIRLIGTFDFQIVSHWSYYCGVMSAPCISLY